MEEILLNLFTIEGFVTMLEYLVIGAEILYVLFAFIMTREIALMTNSFRSKPGKLFITLGYAHLIAALVLVVYSVFAI